MIRIPRGDSACETTGILCRSDVPKVKKRASPDECSPSGYVTANESMKTLAPSTNETLCFVWFDAAFRLSQSNSNTIQIPKRPTTESAAKSFLLRAACSCRRVVQPLRDGIPIPSQANGFRLMPLVVVSVHIHDDSITSKLPPLRQSKIARHFV